MPRGSKTKPNNALSAGISYPSLATSWSQSNQGIHRMTPDLDSSASAPDSEGYPDHLRVMMQTRVAVRDNTPHRFQIVPLREVSNLGLEHTEISTRLNIPTTPLNNLRHSPSGKLGPYSQTRPLQFLSPLPSLNQLTEGRDAVNPVAPEGTLLAKLDATPRSVGHPGYRRSRSVLVELDLNRDSGLSMATTKFTSKPITDKSVHIRSLPSRDLLMSHSAASITQTTPRASNGSQSRQDEMHHTQTTHISQISQLFSSENVVSLPPTRRNRSMTVTSIRTDTSVGMSDTSRETEAKLKRRHAIYRESSCMPYLGKSQERNTVALDVNLTIPAMTDINKGTKFARPGPFLQPPFELKQKTSVPQVAGRSGISHLPNSGAAGFVRVLPLKLHKTNVSRRTTANHGETVYSRIVLELFRDIDTAIAQWGGS